MTRQEIIRRPRTSLRPHVVLLGAGASRAALPRGDRLSRPIPLMHDLVGILNLRPTIERFEEFRNENWDPFLFDAYMRNADVAGLPAIFFLHGNVRIGRCLEHEVQWGPRSGLCPTCGELFTNVPLLYPVGDKSYSNDLYIRNIWECAEHFFREALLLTIFGYSAPRSDVAAMNLLRSAWVRRSDRKMEHVEMIDIEPEAKLYGRWKEFTPTGHFHARKDRNDSWITRWPRRSREAVFDAMSAGIPRQIFPLSDTEDLIELQAEVREVAQWETGKDREVS